jgi:hypothetical protein
MKRKKDITVSVMVAFYTLLTSLVLVALTTATDIRHAKVPTPQQPLATDLWEVPARPVANFPDVIATMPTLSVMAVDDVDSSELPGTMEALETLVAQEVVDQARKWGAL